MSQSPFGFTGKYFGNGLKVIDVGGPGNLFPSIRTDKIYDLKKICQNCESPNNCFVFGPGAGPRHKIGVNCEAVIDAKFADGNLKVNTHTTKIIDENSYKLEETASTEFCLMANLAISDISENQNPPKVLKISTKKRIGTLNYPESIRQFFVSYFPEAFTNSWLKYFEISAPLTCATVIHSKDNEKLSLRLEHTHCFSNEMGSGGHYHEDTTAETIEYEGYFSPAEFLYRVDHVSGQL
uniref:DUF1907 domain-containing protein n=1 Tax=Panagrolaimus davidi TaxID=227884 RepID=A0A914PNF7_9BILA